MDRPVVRFAFPAAVVATVALGLFESIIPHQFGVGRAEDKKVEEKKKEEQKKEEAGLGFTCRQRRTQTMSPGELTETIRESPVYGSRTDTYDSGKVICSMYTNYADGTVISLFHGMKTYTRRPGPKGPPPAEQTQDPRPKIKKALAGEHKELGRRTIDGVETEGIEVPETGGMVGGNNGATVKVDRAVVQFWSSVATGDPILVEREVVAGNGKLRFKMISDQFHWNIRFDPNEFKAKIPPDYQLDTRQPGQGGFGGFGRGEGMGSPAPPRSRQKTRR
jgi:hypothetical protein